MQRRFLALAAVLAAGCCFAQADQIWQVRTGVTTLSLFTERLEALGLKVTDVMQSADPAEGLEGEAFGFLIGEDSTMGFRTRHGVFQSWTGGEIHHSGGFALHNTAGNTRQAVRDFRISYKDAAVREDLLVRGADAQAPAMFDLNYAAVHFDRFSGMLLIGAVDVYLTPAMAQALGRPELANELLGTASAEAFVERVGGEEYDGDRTGGGTQQAATLDLQLFAMQSLTSLGHIGTFPNGVSGLAMSTTACNVGDVDIQWRAPMNENHPVIAMQMYRVENDRFEQIGMAWLKHGFFATNSTSSGCAPCNHPGTGSLLGPGCSDTYGTSNNGDRFYLGPRSELNPFTGKWTCANSYFACGQATCVRRCDQSSCSDRCDTGLDAVEHRLEVRDADLGHAGATYYYEAYYILQGDVSRANNIGYRQVSTTWTGSIWTFSSLTAKTFGPALNVWGDLRSVAEPQTEGQVILAVKVKNLGGGQHHYEYALLNLDSDRQIQFFSVPIPPGVTVGNVGFRDVDQDATNDWTNNLSGGQLTWQTQTFAQNPNANSVKFCTTYNFWFDANSAPTNATGTLGLFKPGTVTSLTAATKGPAANFVLGDLNCDGARDFFDVDPFVLAVTDPAAYAAQYPGCDPDLADMNCDNALDFFDIDPFVDCVLNGNCGCP